MSGGGGEKRDFTTLQVARVHSSGGGDVVGREMRSYGTPHADAGRWLAGLDILRLPSENVIVRGNFLLGEGAGGNWAGQTGGSS